MDPMGYGLSYLQHFPLELHSFFRCSPRGIAKKPLIPMSKGMFMIRGDISYSQDIFVTFFIDQWLFLFPAKGGRWHIIPQLAVYTTYIPLILYSLLGGYMLPTTYYQNQNNSMNIPDKYVPFLKGIVVISIAFSSPKKSWLTFEWFHGT